MITERQRAARTSGIGSSDAGAILGLNIYRRAADVRLAKLGLLADEPASELAEIGTALEDGIAVLAEKRLGRPLVKPTATYIHPQLNMLRANIDRQVERPARGCPPVECKDSGIDDGWGEPGTDQVPGIVRAQVLLQCICCGADEAHVARLSRGLNRGFSLYHLDATKGANNELRLAMLEFLPAWWEKYVVRGEELPEQYPPPSLDVLRRVMREPETTVPVEPSLVLEWRRADEEEKRAKAAADEAKARVIDALGTAEGGTCEHGRLTYFEQTRREYVCAESTFRVLRFKASK